MMTEAIVDFRSANPARNALTAVSPMPTLNGLGVLPLAIGAGAVAGAGGVVAGQKAYEAGLPWWDALWQTVGLKSNPALPVNPAMPSNRPPVAPQTAEAMRTWDMTYLMESTAQANRQQAIDAGYYQTMLAGAAGPQDWDNPNPDGSPRSGFPVWGYVVAGTAALLFLTYRKNR